MYKRIRDLREDKDLSQKEIASILNMSQTGYSKYEVGTNDVPTKILIQLANFYNTSVDYILGLTNEIKPYKMIKNGELLHPLQLVSHFYLLILNFFTSIPLY